MIRRMKLAYGSGGILPHLNVDAIFDAGRDLGSQSVATSSAMDPILQSILIARGPCPGLRSDSDWWSLGNTLRRFSARELS
jgi:hypothetical protein